MAFSVEKMKDRGQWESMVSSNIFSFFLMIKSILLLALMPCSVFMSSAKDAPTYVEEPLDIALVWSAHPVDFCLLTHAPYQFVAFYDQHRQLTVAQRLLTEKKWVFTRLPDTTGWDSHNYLTMAIDDDGFLHLSGDMHCVPLNYYRSTRAFDASSLTKVPQMVGANEQRTTYPRFLRGAKNVFLFTYRDGGSGDGNQLYNVYNQKTKTWSRLMDQPLTDGEGLRNAYFNGPILGSDNYFHLAWVWRESPDASTNHDLSYARSKDMIHWENAQGKPLTLPIKLNDGAIVDPVPQKGGIINGNATIGFDVKGRVTISYHKHDQQGFTQPWTARLEEGKWTFHKITDWPWHWDFGGGGTLGFAIRVGPVMKDADGRLVQDFSHQQFGGGTWLLDPETLEAKGKISRSTMPSGFGKAEGTFPGLTVKSKGDDGAVNSKNVRYTLRWEALPANRDLPRSGELPPPSMLRLYSLKR